ncbi:porin [Pseudomonadota bacterium]
MQKKLIALAVAGIMAAPMAASAASAEVYGKVRVSVASVGNDDANAQLESSKLSVTSHSSRLGVKGSEDLGGGLTAVYQLETQVDFDDNNNGLFDGQRNTYVGLAGDFGTVVAGVHDTPYKTATGKIEIFGDTHADYNAIMASGHDARADNVIAYISPDMNGFSLFAAYVTDLNDDNLVDTTSTSATVAQENAAISISGTYTAGPLYAALAIQSLGESGAANAPSANHDADATKIAVGYNLGATDLGFVYEDADGGGSNNDRSTMYFSVKHDMGGMNLKGAYGIADDLGNNADTGATFLAFGVSKDLTKTVELYALYAAIDNDTNGTFSLDAVGSAGATSPAANALAVGINLKFSSM